MKEAAARLRPKRVASGDQPRAPCAAGLGGGTPAAGGRRSTDERERRTDSPPGWSYNPSAWRERLPLVALAAVGFAAAFYTGFYQLGIIPQFWDPFFGTSSSYLVTHSVVSRILPFPDGLLGLLGYFCDMLFGSLGGPDRWRRMPWAVLAFCGTITALCLVSVLLTITMGVLVKHWCTVCLVSASISVLIFGLGIGEALPVLQYLKRVYVETRSLKAVWYALWGRSDCHVGTGL